MLKTNEELNLIIAKVTNMINEAKTNNTLNLERFVSNPYEGFNTGKIIVRKLSLGTEKDFNNLISIVNARDYSPIFKEEILTVLWVFRSLKEDSAIKRAERREQALLGLYKVPFPYSETIGEDDVVEDATAMCNIFDYLSNLKMASKNVSFESNSSKILEECLSKITEEERYLIIQHYILCRSNNDIALEYGLNESSIRRRIANIIKKMK